MRLASLIVHIYEFKRWYNVLSLYASKKNKYILVVEQTREHKKVKYGNALEPFPENNRCTLSRNIRLRFIKAPIS